MPELNLLDLLSADHHNLAKTAPRPEILAVSQHLAVERDFLYPAIADHVENGASLVADLRRAERQLEERLRDVEKDATPEHLAHLEQAIKDHVSVQEELFGRLRQQIPESALLTPSESIALSIGGAPTHAHPHLAEGGLIGAIVEDFTSMEDHVRDHLHGKDAPESQ